MTAWNDGVGHGQVTQYNNFLGPALDPIKKQGLVVTNTYLPMANATGTSATPTCAGGQPRLLEVVGQKALVVCSGPPAALELWDISNRSHPVLASSTPLAAGAVSPGR